jgi:hypothetical protein
MTLLFCWWRRKTSNSKAKYRSPFDGVAHKVLRATPLRMMGFLKGWRSAGNGKGEIRGEPPLRRQSEAVTNSMLGLVHRRFHFGGTENRE